MTLAAFIDAPYAIRTWFLLVATVAAIGGTYALNRKGEERFLREKVYPTLVMCLSPLKPTPDELKAVLARSNAKTAKQVVVGELVSGFGDVSPTAPLTIGVKLPPIIEQSP